MIDAKNFTLTLRTSNRQLFNPTCIKHRRFDAHIATAKNCGTHWIKYMLSFVLAKSYDLPEPTYIKDESLVGHPSKPTIYTDIPQICITHSHPHYLMRFPYIHQALDLPLYAVMVRDIRHALVSLYEKWKPDLGDISFSEYLHGDISGKRRVEDIWGLILFYNAWGAIGHYAPETTKLMRYEDFKSDPEQQLQELCAFLGFENMDPSIIQYAVKQSSKDKMKQKLDKTEDHFEKTVNLHDRNPLEWYSQSDMDFVTEILGTYLRYDFGYDYS